METDWKEAIMNDLDHPQAPALSATPPSPCHQRQFLSLHQEYQVFQAKPLSNPCLLANNSNIGVHPHLLSLSQRNCVLSPAHVCRCCLDSDSLSLTSTERPVFWLLFLKLFQDKTFQPFSKRWKLKSSWGADPKLILKENIRFLHKSLLKMCFIALHSFLCMWFPRNFCPVSLPMPVVLSHKQSEPSSLPLCIDSGKFRASSVVWLWHV